MTELDRSLVVRSARLRAELTQEQLAQKVGLSRFDIIDIEKGRRDVDDELYMRLLEACGTTVQAAEEAYNAFKHAF